MVLSISRQQDVFTSVAELSSPELRYVDDQGVAPNVRHAELDQSAIATEACGDLDSDVERSPSTNAGCARPEFAERPRISGYEICGRLGRGGMGVVYRAGDVREVGLDRTVAIKLLPAHFAQNANRLERFRREARVLCQLNHPAICTVYDVGEHNGAPFIVMEFVEGRTLRALVKECVSLERLVNLFRQTALALKSAHAEGIVHRDIKPDNLMVRDDGYVKVLDFGLAPRRQRKPRVQ